MYIDSTLYSLYILYIYIQYTDLMYQILSQGILVYTFTFDLREAGFCIVAAAGLGIKIPVECLNLARNVSENWP